MNQAPNSTQDTVSATPGHRSEAAPPESGSAASLRRTLALDPADLAGWIRLAECHGDDGADTAAVTSLERALRIDPGSAAANWRYALALLAAGRWVEGWQAFECRPSRSKLPPNSPQWDGSPIEDGATLLLIDEQGFGDAIQFSRYLAHVPRQPGGRVVLACKPAIAPLLAKAPGLDAAVGYGVPVRMNPRRHAVAPLLSLPLLLGMADPGATRWPARYLAVDATADRPRGGKPVVALCWRGNPTFKQDARRSPGLAPFLPLLDLPFEWRAFQVGPGREELSLHRSRGELPGTVADIGEKIEGEGMDWLGTAGLLAECDAVVAPDTGLAHLAGALGLPVWLITSNPPEWRWRTGAVWYPTMRIVPQDRSGDWSGAVAVIRDELWRWAETTACA